jgi:hypothetical protein
MEVPTATNIRWSLDFVSNAFARERWLCILAVIDGFTWENLALIADYHSRARVLSESSKRSVNSVAIRQQWDWAHQYCSAGVGSRDRS